MPKQLEDADEQEVETFIVHLLLEIDDADANTNAGRTLKMTRGNKVYLVIMFY
jgi:hypothetical protein